MSGLVFAARRRDEEAGVVEEGRKGRVEGAGEAVRLQVRLPVQVQLRTGTARDDGRQTQVEGGMAVNMCVSVGGRLALAGMYVPERVSQRVVVGGLRAGLQLAACRRIQGRVGCCSERVRHCPRYLVGEGDEAAGRRKKVGAEENKGESKDVAFRALLSLSLIAAAQS